MERPRPERVEQDQGHERGAPDDLRREESGLGDAAGTIEPAGADILRGEGGITRSILHERSPEELFTYTYTYGGLKTRIADYDQQAHSPTESSGEKENEP